MIDLITSGSETYVDSEADATASDAGTNSEGEASSAGAGSSHFPEAVVPSGPEVADEEDKADGSHDFAPASSANYAEVYEIPPEPAEIELESQVDWGGSQLQSQM